MNFRKLFFLEILQAAEAFTGLHELQVSFQCWNNINNKVFFKS